MRKLEEMSHGGRSAAITVREPSLQKCRGQMSRSLRDQVSEGFLDHMKDRLFSYRWLSTGAVPGLVWVGVYISLLSQWLGGFSWHVVACTQGHLTSYNVGGLSSPMKNFLSLQNFQKSSIILRKTVGNNTKPLKGFEQESVLSGQSAMGGSDSKGREWHPKKN